ncbi:LytTR family DNA-binding domain-containing protein [Niabella pedocola]|uniref:LytTR family DNA-binding domain-containing protein n=1 Tax=Niabella pedocola TaxID=1752077 RepID=A0ABS8PPH1_9BACT|nr:LytTR family DNA-binding domain-containing protein [Niabella pedocola]MCD2422183.1 LytTR family DNA-binding domain-containing protein [Niabella pedocola]
MIKDISCLILDDEPIAARLLAQYVKRTEGMKLHLQTDSAEAALKAITHHNIDLVLLDIEMPGMNGVELMKIIHAKTHIIITTAYPEYAVEGYEHNAVDFLMKPVTFERFSLAILRVRERMVATKEMDRELMGHFFIKSGHRIHRINYQDILFIEGLRDYIAIHTIKGKIMSLDSLTNMEILLPKVQFSRIHKSYLINKTKIDSLEKWKVVIHDHPLPVGETYRKKLTDELGL